MSRVWRRHGEANGHLLQAVVGAGETTIGASPENDLVFDYPAVSRWHAVVRRTSSGLVLEDAGSKNRTYVDGARITSSAIGEGDTIRIGLVPLTLELVAADDTQLAVALPAPRLTATRAESL
jgi:predicted component of type VI protein secretion system